MLRDLAGQAPYFFQDVKKINANAGNTACEVSAVQLYNLDVSAVFRKS